MTVRWDADFCYHNQPFFADLVQPHEFFTDWYVSNAPQLHLTKSLLQSQMISCAAVFFHMDGRNLMNGSRLPYAPDIGTEISYYMLFGEIFLK